MTGGDGLACNAKSENGERGGGEKNVKLGSGPRNSPLIIITPICLRYMMQTDSDSD